MAFDPSQPFEELDVPPKTEEIVGFDPSAPFEELGDDQPVVPERTWGEAAQDVGVQAVHGLQKAGQAVIGIGDLATAGLDQIVGGGQGLVPTVTEQLKNTYGVDFQAADIAAQELKSEATRAAQQNVGQAFEQEGLMAGAKAIYDNPLYAADLAIESLPGMAALGATVRAKAAAIYTEALKRGGPQAAMAALKEAAPRLATLSAGLEAGQTAGTAASESSYNGQLTGTEALAALGSGLGTFIGGKVAGKLVGDVEAEAAAKAAQGAGIGEIVKTFLGGVAKEGVEEGIQSPLEQAAPNIAAGRPVTEGMGRAAIEGAIVGGLTGGPMSMTGMARSTEGDAAPTSGGPVLTADGSEPSPANYQTEAEYIDAYRTWRDIQSTPDATEAPGEPAAEQPAAPVFDKESEERFAKIEEEAILEGMNDLLSQARNAEVQAENNLRQIIKSGNKNPEAINSAKLELANASAEVKQYENDIASFKQQAQPQQLETQDAELSGQVTDKPVVPQDMQGVPVGGQVTGDTGVPAGSSGGDTSVGTPEGGTGLPDSVQAGTGEADTGISLKSKTISDEQSMKYIRNMLDLTEYDDAFKTPISNKKDIKSIFNDVDKKDIEENYSEDVTPKKENNFATKEHSFRISWKDVDDAGNPKKMSADFLVLENDNDGTVWISAADLKSGKSGGFKIYDAVSDYAANTGKKFIGDPDGLTDIAAIRRTENMFRAAIRHGGRTDFLVPHPKQTGKMSLETGDASKYRPLDWKEGDSGFHNLQELAKSAYFNLVSQVPEVDGMKVVNGKVVDSKGNNVSDKQLGEIYGRYEKALKESGFADKREIPGANDSANGRSDSDTQVAKSAGAALIRAIVAQSEGGVIRERMGLGSSDEQGGRNVRIDLLSKADKPASMATVDAVGKMLRRRIPGIAKHVVVVPSWKSVNGASPDANGFYKNGKVYLFANQIQDADDAVRVALHEVVGHKGVIALLGDKANNVYSAIVNSKDPAVAKMRQAIEKKYAEELAAQENQTDRDAVLALEVLAGFSEGKKENPTVIDWAYAKLKKLLSMLTGNKDFNLYDINALLEDSHRYMERMPRAEPVGGKPKQLRAEAKSKKDVGEVREYAKRIVSRRMTPKINQQSKEKAKRALQRWFTKEGLLTPADRLAQEQMMGEMREANAIVGPVLTNRMKAAFKADYGTTMEANPNRRIDVVDYLNGKNVKLPANVKSVADEMRAVLDHYSTEVQKTLVDLVKYQTDEMDADALNEFSLYMSGAQDAKTTIDNAEGQAGTARMAEAVRLTELWRTIEANKGTYMNVSYQADHDPRWMEKVWGPGGNKGNYARPDLVQPAIDQYMKDNPNKTEEDARQYVYNLLKKHEGIANPNDFMGHVSAVRKMGVLKQRTKMTPAFERLLGKYENPLYSFNASLSKMANLTGAHKFLNGMRKNGLASGIFRKTPAVGYVKVGDSESLAPLSGLYVDEAYEQAIKDVIEKDHITPMMHGILQTVGLIKMGKTVFSPTTSLVNFLSNWQVAYANGHIIDGIRDGAYKNAFNLIKDFYTKDGSNGSMERMKELARLGIFDETAYSSEVKALLKQMDWPDQMKQPSKAMEKLRPVEGFFELAYQLGDLFWKVAAYDIELKKAHEAGLKGEQAKQSASQLVRDTYPTYSNVSRAVNWLKKMPLFGDFPSFTWEMGRTLVNQVKIIKQLSDAGDKAAAATRAVNLIAAIGLPSVMAYAANLAAGFDDDETDKLKKNYLPDWKKNATVAFSKDKDGNLKYTDLGRASTYDGVIKPIRALLNDDYTAMEKVAGAISESLLPLVGVEFIPKSIINAAQGEDQYGKPLYPETAPAWEKRQREVVAMWNALGPTLLVKNIPNVYRSQSDVVNAMADKLGMPGLATVGSTQYKDFNASDEINPFPTSRVPIGKIIEGKAYQQQEDEKIAKNTVTAPWKVPMKQLEGAPGKISNAQLEQAAKDFLDAHDRSWKPVMDAARTAIETGVADRRQVSDALKAANVSSKDINSILDGEVPKYRLPKDLPKRMAEKIGRVDGQMKMAKERARAERRAVREKRRTQ